MEYFSEPREKKKKKKNCVRVFCKHICLFSCKLNVTDVIANETLGQNPDCCYLAAVPGAAAACWGQGQHCPVRCSGPRDAPGLLPWTKTFFQTGYQKLSSITTSFCRKKKNTIFFHLKKKKRQIKVIHTCYFIEGDGHTSPRQ